MIKLIKSKTKLKQNFKILDEYKECIADLINHKDVKLMETYIQHSNINCLEHSVSVSYRTFIVCKYLGFNYKAVARGGLLHDFFLYDWHTRKPKKRLHGLIHPSIALNNANERFILNEIEKDIIKKHMWPLTLQLPKYKESYIVVLIDKYCSVMEIIGLHNKKGLRDFVIRLK